MAKNELIPASENLLLMQTEQIREIVRQLPVEERAPWSKRAKAVCQYLRAAKEDYGKAYTIACASMENWRLLGLELPDLISPGRPGKKRRNVLPLTLGKLGVQKHESPRCQKMAEMASKEFDIWLGSLRDSKNYKLPSLFMPWGQGQSPAEVNLDEPGKYRVIYADPPWKYSDGRADVSAGGAVAKYELLGIDQLVAMDVAGIAARDAVLFLWATVPMLPESLQVIDAWGFEYKTHLIWDKVRPYYGNYSHVQHELLMVCTKGSCCPGEGSQLPRSIIQIEKGGHSFKPREFPDLIDALYPDGGRIELFARETREGWKSWGDQVTSSND